VRAASKADLGPLHDDSDWPTNVRERFAMHWRFVSMAPAESSLLSPALVARERDKFLSLMQDAAKEAVTALRVRFAECVDHCVERLSPSDGAKPKVFRDSLVENLREFFGSFGSLNLVGDGELEALVKRAQEMLSGVDAQALREDGGLRAHVAGQMSSIQTTLDSMQVDRPTRKITIKKAAAPVPSASAAAEVL
jgi:hypothetical protein